MNRSPIQTAVIPAAGFGTRMLPAAKAVAKELLPVLDRPVIQYVVEECADAGVSEAVLITSPQKPAILRHFEPADELARRLRKSGKAALLESIDRLIARVRVTSVDQHEQRGLGHAVLQGRQRTGGHPFLCLLGDTIFSGDLLPARQLTEVFARLGTALIGLEEVPVEKVGRYGIAGGEEIEPGLLRLHTLVEKPSPQAAPSRLAVAARYVLTPGLFDCLERTSPGKGGEIQLTDALRLLLEREPVHGVVLGARRHDIGNPIDWLRTNILFAANDPHVWEQIRPALDEVLRR